jgi:hypothetical protein
MSSIANARYSVEYLESLPTLHQGQADDCKLDDGETRIWLSRCTVEDGEPYNNKVTVERLVDGRWVETETYPAQ